MRPLARPCPRRPLLVRLRGVWPAPRGLWLRADSLWGWRRLADAPWKVYCYVEDDDLIQETVAEIQKASSEEMTLYV